jgi:hypothetical protein
MILNRDVLSIARCQTCDRPGRYLIQDRAGMILVGRRLP